MHPPGPGSATGPDTEGSTKQRTFWCGVAIVMGKAHRVSASKSIMKSDQITVGANLEAQRRSHAGINFGNLGK